MTMKSAGVAAICSLVLASSVAFASGNSPRIDLLGWLGQGSGGTRQSTAHAINNFGQVVGESTFQPGSSRAYRYSDGIGMVNLGSFPGDPASVQALGVSDAGEIVGWASAFQGEVGYRHQGTGGFTVIGDPQSSTRATAINDNGLVVGYTNLPGIGNTAFSQLPNGPRVAFGGRSTVPLRVNNSGVATGYTPNVSSSMDRAFITTAGGLSLLPIPNDSNRSYGRGINDQGQVVGDTLNNALSNTGAFIWSEALGFQRLALLQPGTEARANAINNSSWIVGNHMGTGVLWMPGQNPLNLSNYVHTILGRPDIMILTAEDINDHGQIVGQASIAGVFQGYRLTIPSPSTLLLCPAALAAAGLRRRR